MLPIFEGFLRRLPPSFLRFFLVGVAGFAVDVAALYAAIHLAGLSPMNARLVSFLVAATFTWFLNRRFNFGASNASPIVEWARFLLANSLGQGVNLGVYALLLWLLPSGFWTPLIAAAVGSVAGLLINYSGSRMWVFSR